MCPPPMACTDWRPVQGCGPGSSSERTRTAITAALRKKLKDLMGEFQELRQRLQDEYRCAAVMRFLVGFGDGLWPCCAL